MRYENNEYLRRWLEEGGVPEHNGVAGFEFDVQALTTAHEEVCRQHPELTEPEAKARAAYRLLTKDAFCAKGTPAGASAPGGTTSQTWRIAQIAWGVAILLLLLLLALRAKAEPEPRDLPPGVRAAVLAHGLFAQTPQPSGIILQLQNQGSVLATRPAGLVVLNCAANMSCSFSGTTFTLTAGAGGAVAWSGITNPTANLGLSHAAFTTTFTWGAATGAGVNLFSLTDTLNNTGTGILLRSFTASGSALTPFQTDVNGNGVKLNTSGVLVKVGTGSLDYGSLSGFPAACGANLFATQIAATPGCTQPAFSNVSGTATKTQLPAATVFTDQANTFGAFAQDFEGASVTRPFRRLAFASFPATCTANREFLERSDPAIAGQVVYVCNAAGTGWDLVGDGGAGGSVPSPGANGMVACTGTACSTSAARTITGTTGNVTVTNGDGVAGNPTLDLGSTAVQTDQANTFGAFTQDFEGASVTRPFRRLAFASFPGTCTANREFLERSDPATAGQVVYVCNAAGTGWDLVGDGGGGASTWNSITSPSGAQALTMGANNTTWTWDSASGVFKSSHTSAFSTGPQFLIEQVTGVPTGGTLLEARAATAAVTAFKAGDGTGFTRVNKDGTLEVNVGAEAVGFVDLCELAANGTDCIGFKAPAAAIATADAGRFELPVLPAAAGFLRAGARSANVSVLTTTTASGTGGCTNQFARTLNDAAAPTCGTVAVADVAAPLKTWSLDVTLDAPTTGDTNKVQWYLPSNGTITRVACSVGAATSVTIQLDERAEATPNTAGTDVMTAALACTTTSGTTTAFTNATIAARVPLNMQITAVSGTPGSLRVHIEGTYD